MTKIVAVICNDIHDFESWGKTKGSLNSRYHNRKIYRDDTVYIGIYKPEHTCSVLFDEIIQTNDAHLNPNFDSIWTSTICNLKKTDENRNVFAKENLEFLAILTEWCIVHHIQFNGKESAVITSALQEYLKLNKKLA